MKDKILTFIIGVLVGAIIATVGFYFYSKNNSNNKGGFPDGDRPQMMQDGNSSGMPNGTPPEKPDGDDSNGTSRQRPDNVQNDSSNTNQRTTSENNSSNT